MVFSLLENSGHVVASVSIDFLCGLRNHLGDVQWEVILKLSASTAATEFCE